MLQHARKLVVAGLVVSPDGKVLITQRRADQPLPLKWELPGGKIEPGESPTAALVRELSEEIGAQVQVGRIWEVLYHPYETFELFMLVYRCELMPGETAQCIQVSDLAWCIPGELGKYDILEADRPLLARLQIEGIPGAAP